MLVARERRTTKKCPEGAGHFWAATASLLTHVAVLRIARRSLFRSKIALPKFNYFTGHGTRTLKNDSVLAALVDKIVDEGAGGEARAALSAVGQFTIGPGGAGDVQMQPRSSIHEFL